MLSSPHDSPFIPVLCVPRSSRNSDGVTPCGGAKYRWGIKFSRFSTNKSLYLANDTSIAMVAMDSGGSGVFILGVGALGWRHFHLGGHTTNTFALNYRVCNRLYQIIHINTHKHIHTGKVISCYVMYIIRMSQNMKALKYI